MTIASAVQSGQLVRLYNERGQVIHTFNVGTSPNDGLAGYTSSAVTIRQGAFMRTYNERGQLMSTTTAK